MNLRIVALAIASLSGLLLLPSPAWSAEQADFIVAVVNSEPITNAEVRAEVQRASKRLAQQQQALPAPEILRRDILESMVNERAQLQLARETGIKANEASIDMAEQNVAQQNKVDVAQLHRLLAADGIDVATFRAQLRDQQILARLRERDVESRIRVTELDIDRYLLDQKNTSTDPFLQEINLAQILIAIPEKTTNAQLPALQKQAQTVLERIRNGEDFAKLVGEVSAADRSKGGQLGLRRADRYPRSFVLATQSLDVGGVSEIVRSGAGFHILKVVEKRAPSAVVKTVVQSRARHILLRTNAQLAPEAALTRLADLKKRIQAGSITFVKAAHDYSQDSTAAEGGDLGWAMPGMFVPEFEEAMARLTDGQISEPLLSRFGAHLIQLMERRRVDLDPRQLREAVRNELRSSRYEEAFSTWAQDIRDRAFVDYREAPQ